MAQFRQMDIERRRVFPQSGLSGSKCLFGRGKPYCLAGCRTRPAILASSDAPERKRTLPYRRYIVIFLALVGATVFAGLAIIMQNSSYITGSNAFGPGGFLVGYAGQGYYQTVTAVMAFDSVAAVAGVVVGVRSAWYPFAVVEARRRVDLVAEWIAVFVILGFVASLFLLVLPLTEVGAFAVLGTLSVAFGLVGYLGLWNRNFPEELMSSAERDSMLRDLKSIDLETSLVQPLVESVHHDDPVLSSQAAAGGTATKTAPIELPASADPLATAPNSRVWGDVALAAIPGFFGLMGLAQFKEGNKSRGLGFLGAGLALGALSSWYFILPERLGEFLGGNPIMPVASLSWLSAVGSSANWLVAALLGAFLLLWVVQLYDAVREMQKRVQAEGNAAVGL
jgi:hypothetical protein